MLSLPRVRVAFLAVVCLFAASAAAAPTIDVRAATRLEVDTPVRTRSGTRISGRLVERGTDAPIGSQFVHVSVDGGEPLPHTTGGDGRFAFTIELSEGAHDVSARYHGVGSYADSNSVEVAFDLGKENVELRLTGPAELPADADVLRVTVEARGQAGPLDLPVSLDMGGTRLALLDTGEEGRATVEIARATLGGPGDKELTAIFAGDRIWNPARDTARVRVVSRTELVEVTGPSGVTAYEDDVEVRGRLVETGGGAVAGAAVGLFYDTDRVADAMTDRDGRFTLSVGGSELATGRVTLQARYVPTVSFRLPAASAPILVTIAEPRPVPLRYTVAAFVLTALLLGGFVLVRTGAWERLVALMARLRRRAQPGAGDGGAHPDAPPTPGLKHGKPSLVSTLRRAADHGVDGVVRDATRVQLVAGARVVVSTRDEAREAVSGEGGAFALEDLPAGIHEARVLAHGYVAERFSLTIPHRGELRGVVVDLLPVRERIFAIYKEVARPVLPSAEVWGVWTPREILDHVRVVSPAGALGALTDFVEEACFSQRTPNEDRIPAAEDLAAAARTELTTGVPRPTHLRSRAQP